MASSFGQFFTGAPSRVEQVNKYNPGQQSIFPQLQNMGLQGLRNPYQGFEPIAQRATSQFNQQIVPSLAERFTSMGSNSLSSPAFASQLGSAGAGLQEALAALQSQYGQQQQSHFSNLLGMGLTPQYENFKMDAEPGLLQQILPLLGRIGGHALGAGLTGGISTIPSALGEILQMLAAPQQRQ